METGTPVAMTAESRDEGRNLAILSGQASLATIGWTLASPSVVLVYLAITLDVPVFLAGLLMTVRRSANLATTLFGSEFAANRPNRKRDLAATDGILALCFLLAIASVALGTSTVVTITFILIVACIGFTEEFQSLLNYDFMADVLHSGSRMRLLYTAMIIGGLGTMALAWSAHLLMIDSPALARHSTIVLIATACFCLSATAMLLVRELTSGKKPDSDERQQIQPTGGKVAIRHYLAGLAELWSMAWFRRFLTVRLSLQTIELSIPFFAILAALSHGTSQKGLTALVISSALALTVAAPIWRLVTGYSNRLVMLLGAAMAASSGLMLVLNHFLKFADTILAHAVALFLVTVAVQGVQTARYLYYMDIAPKEYRVRGLAVSKSVSRISGIALTTVMAALAHTQHVVWAIVALACLNVLAACFAFVTARQQADPQTGSPELTD